MSVGVAVAVFLLLAAVDHLLTATALRGTYERDLGRGINRFRWVEYSFSATIMIVRHRLLLRADRHHHRRGRDRRQRGHDPVRLAAGGGEPARARAHDDAAVLVRRRWRGRRRGSRSPSTSSGPPAPPGFVIGIYVSLLILFFTFAVNQWLQYRGIGKWRDYAFGEKVYLVLSLVAKSLLAWQIFGGSLAS